MKRIVSAIGLSLLLAACEKPITLDDSTVGKGNVAFSFSEKSTERVSVMVFGEDGSRALSKVKTQAPGKPMAVSLEEGDYVVVAVAHSSEQSPTIKSAQQVQFTASDGKKLTDTYCCVEQIAVGEQPIGIGLQLQHATAQVRFHFLDALPASVTALRFEYSGGSANVNPLTLEGYTKSSQTELRAVIADGIYDIYTFPYQSDHGTLKITATALDALGNEVYSRTFAKVNVSRGKRTEITGSLLPGGADMGFTIDSDWEEEVIEF